MSVQARIDPRSARERRLAEMRRWHPTQSHPVRNVEVALSSVYAQRLFNVAFFFTQRAAYGMSVLVPIIGTKEQGEAVDRHLRDMLEGIEKDLTRDLADIEKIKNNEGISAALDGYTKVLNEVVPCYTPESRRFLSLVLNYDRFCAIVDELWMAGAWRKAQRDEKLESWRKKLLAFSTEVNTLHTRTLRAARNAKAAREAAADARFARTAQRHVKAVDADATIEEARAAEAKAREEAALNQEADVHQDFAAAVIDEDTRRDDVVPAAQPSAEVMALHSASDDAQPSIAPEPVPASKSSKRPSKTLNAAAIA